MKRAEYADLFANPYTAAQRGFVDEVSQDTHEIDKAFSMLENKSQRSRREKRTKTPTTLSR
jgi:propionyl-CoA carboxylase beta chain